ncbi:glycoside hydrolase family 18 protein [Bacillus sp. BRMEA1]|uniref:glycosyl hydrolase family 18 protein n=1 Tax=Neobacillus endophyticus TaxID=2738405 RepID=UPI0015656248|nr:glycoside hydrolase family 18 protein [Neobacillus endophyticus]NRD77438.1 glycoside hydrolase family 18 protein [Neobacillus endophyticus]
MQIHVVRQNESLTTIARTFHTTTQDIVEANDLPNPNNLVVGQSLVIPIVGRFHFVQSGDTVQSIARKEGVSAQQVASVNQISVNQTLQTGQRLYIPAAPKRNAEFNGYVEPRSTSILPSLENSAREAGPYLTYLAPFAFQAQRDGTLKEPLLNNFPAIARANRNVLMMVINNQENDQFSDELGRIILTNMAIQNTFLNNIVATAKKYGFRDIHFDFEYLRPVDRDAYNQFLRKAKARFNQEGWLMSTALAPKTSATQKGKWYEGHDYKAHGEISDFVVIMSYEWGYSGGPAMAVSPIDQVRKVMDYAVSAIPSNKILMGQNLYGYDWTLPFVQGTVAEAVSPQEAIQRAAQHNVPIQYDEKSQAPHFNYTAADGKQHEVWFEDARSIQAKFNLIKELNLRGMSYWKLGLAFPQNWLLIVENFNVTKRAT